ncbi:MAG TPA: hypothetical protein VGK18_08405 [Propionicimonas sp.]|uniref:hypothetical protein n=1 Tax=Propionicimonas sp. TaxID=1955623 RepID=UPI002F3F226B
MISTSVATATARPTPETTVARRALGGASTWWHVVRPQSRALPRHALVDVQS